MEGYAAVMIVMEDRGIASIPDEIRIPQDAALFLCAGSRGPTKNGLYATPACAGGDLGPLCRALVGLASRDPVWRRDTLGSARFANRGVGREGKETARERKRKIGRACQHRITGLDDGRKATKTLQRMGGGPIYSSKNRPPAAMLFMGTNLCPVLQPPGSFIVGGCTAGPTANGGAFPACLWDGALDLRAHSPGTAI